MCLLLLTSVMVMRMTVTMMMMSPLVTCDDEPAVAVRAGGPGLAPGDSGKRRSFGTVNANLNINFQLFSYPMVLDKMLLLCPWKFICWLSMPML